MRIFRCACGNQVYFENTQCYACGRALGFLPEHLTLSAIEPAGEEWQALAPAASGTLWRMCHNYTEQMRVQMNEAYRTLLGHFRHESGHYFWDQLVRDDPEMLAEYRAVFGDERLDYAGALERHYIEGAPSDWWDRHISKYASSHPWEDWGETWAHYLQMTDALETALAVGLTARNQRGQAVPQADPESVEFSGAAVRRDFNEMLSNWLSLTVALNSINRSLGLGDAYPFALSSAAADKLRFVHRVISRGISP
ncbi:MAG: putative zinc-binding peptidase [Xanthomonadaceae bacterium]|nr:putative zinc-binding peptidase [Xanthomonadaceae bacterium]